jgi:hypothetical protein
LIVGIGGRAAGVGGAAEERIEHPLDVREIAEE